MRMHKRVTKRVLAIVLSSVLFLGGIPTFGGHVAVAKADGVQEISSVKLVMSEPKVGEGLSTTATCNTTGVIVEKTTYKLGELGGFFDLISQVENNSVYLVNISLRVESGYKLADNASVKVNNDTVVFKKTGNNTFEVSYSFFKTDTRVVVDENYLDGSDLKQCFSLFFDDKSAKIRFGKWNSKPIDWLIAGPDQEYGLALLSTSCFDDCKFNLSKDNTIYGDNSNADLTSEVLSKLKAYVAPENTDIFSEREKSVMQDTTVTTADSVGTERKVTNKLYLPTAVTSYPTISGSIQGEGLSKQYANTDISIFVGTNNNIPIHTINVQKYVPSTQYWLRSLDKSVPTQVSYVSYVGGNISTVSKTDSDKEEVRVLPAFNLKMNNVAFASTTPAALGDGTNTEQAIQKAQNTNTYVLRFKPSGSSIENSKVMVNYNQDAALVSNIPTQGNTYLVVQKGQYASAKLLLNTTQKVNASEMTLNSEPLTDFTGCQVWLETTEDNVTYAKTPEASESCLVRTSCSDESQVEVSTDTNNGEANQKVFKGNPVNSVVFIAKDGYYFPENYTSQFSDAMNASLKGMNITRNSAKQITLSGTPTADAQVNIPAATEKQTLQLEQSTFSVVPTCKCSGKINGTTPQMEYRSKDSVNWTACSGTEITGLTPGDYYIRYKETDTTLTSNEVLISIVRKDHTCEGIPTFTWNGYTAIAKYECSECHEEVLLQDVKVTTKETTPATVEKPGIRTYTALVVYNGVTYTDSKTEMIPILKPAGSSNQTTKPVNSPVTNVVTKGMDFVISTLKYRITKVFTKNNGCVSFVKNAALKKKKIIVIGKTVKIKGKTYKITSIGDKALKSFLKLQKVTVGSNITSIGKEAFAGCKALKSITITSVNLSKVGKNAFKNINKNAIIYVNAKKIKKYKKLFNSKTGFKKTMKIKKVNL